MSPPLANESMWRSTVDMPEFAQLQNDLSVDVCIVGGGIAGLSSAYLCAKEGLSVALLEARSLGSGETGNTTAHLAVPDDRYSHIEHLYGAAGARIVAESFARSIDMVESIVEREGIVCDFERVDGYLYSCDAAQDRELDAEFHAAMLAGARVFQQSDIETLEFDVGRCLRFSGQAQFHPLKYLSGLAGASTRLGAQIYCATRVQEVTENDTEVKIKTATGIVTARCAVIATNTPFNDRVTMHTKQSGYQSYVLGFKVPKDVLPHLLLWDDADPYHYVRLAPVGDLRADYEVLIVGGADHKTGQEPHPETHYQAVEEWTRARFSMAGEVLYRWSGEVMEPVDGIAYLGRNPGSRHLYTITGDSGNGMTHATIGAMIVTDLIQGRANPWAELYDPKRKPLRSALEFMKEQANVLKQYGEWLRKTDDIDAASLLPGQGAVVQAGLKKLAVYRDDEGTVHAHSAVCPHLGCAVHWNPAEKTWDCPCHGSRFSAEGEVMHGPAAAGLASVSTEDLPGVGHHDNSHHTDSTRASRT